MKIQQELTVRISGTPGAYSVSATAGRASTAPAPLALPADLVARAKGLIDPQARPTAAEITAVGDALYRAVFNGEVSALYAGLERERREGEAVRLRLITEPDELAGLPWEVMTRDNRLLSEMSNAPFVRTIPAGDGQARREISVQRALNVLFVGASPAGLPPIDTAAVYAQLQAALGPSPALGVWRRLNPWDNTRVLNLDALHHATRATLEDKLKTRDYHVICFAGHGEIGAVYLEDAEPDDDGNRWADEVSADAFARLLGERVQLVYLMACKTGTLADAPTGTTDTTANVVLSGFAQSLAAQTTVPAVVAMQSEISVQVLDAFTADYFQMLSELRPVDVALAEARRVMIGNSYNSITRNSISPVLYLQASGSSLFRQTVNVLLRVLVVLLLAVLAGSGGALYAQAQAATARTAAARAEEIDVRLRTLSHLNRVTSWVEDSAFAPAAAAPPVEIYAPVFAGGLLWWAADDGTVQALAPNGTWRDPVRVGVDAAAPVVLDGAVWVASPSAGLLYRFDATDPTAPRPFPAGADLLPPFLAAGYVWVQSTATDQLLRIDRSSYDYGAVTLLPNTGAVFGDADALYYTSANGALVHVDPATFTPTEIGLPTAEAVSAAGVYDGGLWALQPGQLTRLNPASRTVTASVALPQPATLMTATPDGLWLFDRNTPAVTFVPFATPATPLAIPLGDVPSQVLAAGPGRVLVADLSDTLTLIDTATAAPVGSAALVGAAFVTGAAPTPDFTWVASPSEDTALALDAATGAEYLRLRVCEDPSPPAFDGVNLWFACADDIVSVPNRLAALPADFAADAPNDDRPPVIDGVAWVLQHGAGRVVLAADDRELARVPVGRGLERIVPLGGYVYGVAPEAGFIAQIDPAAARRGRGAGAVRYLYLDGQPNEVTAVGDRLWVTQASLANITETDDIIVVDPASFTEVARYDFGQIVNSITVYEGRVWVSATDTQAGTLYEVDPANPAERTPLPIPGTNFGTWTGVPVNGRLWFPATTPGMATLLGRMDDMLSGTFIEGSGTPEDGAVFIAYDPATGAWGEPYTVPALVLAPSVYDDVLWFTTTEFVVAINERAGEELSSQFGAFDTHTNETVFPLTDLCGFDVVRKRAAGHLLLLGCLSNTDGLWVVDMARRELAATYTNVGIDPLTPVVHDGHVYTVFRDTGTLAVLDASSGTLVYTAAVGAGPSSPFVLDGRVYTYNAGDQTLQVLSLPGAPR